jgi:hypothetical protein
MTTMADVRTLKLNLLADVDQFGRSLAQADNDAKGFAGGLKKYGKIAAAAFVVAGAAAAAYAVKIGIDGVKAAVEDEASQKQLAEALKNTTNATDAQIKSTEAYITKQQLAFGVADTKLRPALANLARATSDVGKAQELTNLALDISASTGRDLETVSLTLAKAYNGNIGALTKLGIPLDENIKKTKDFNVVQDELVRLFGGAAKANTETYAGQLAIVTERVGELKESIGVALLPTMKTLLEEVNKVAKGFSGEDPEGLSNRARELAGNFEGDGAFSLGGALRAVTDAFGNLFSTVTDGGPGAASMMERIAASLETVANAINAISNAYQAALPALRFIQNPLNINLPEAGFTPRPKARAAGGSVMGGQAYRVGEFGPELFVPSGSGSVRPDAGGGQNVTINLNGIVDAESARRSIEKLLQNSARRTGPINLVGATL